MMYYFDDDDYDRLIGSDDELETIMENMWDDEWLMMSGVDSELVGFLREEWAEEQPPMTEADAVEEVIRNEKRVEVCARCGSPDVRLRVGDDLEQCWECGSLETIWISVPDDQDELPF